MRDYKSLFTIIDNSMAKLDIRLQKHLNRVAYLTLEYARRNKFNTNMTNDLVLSSYFHDIGIINTGKVNNLLKLESETLVEHSAFGYVYLKYYAKELFPAAMMYHHTPYSKINGITEYEKYLANIVNAMDKIDFAIFSAVSLNKTANIVEYVENYVSNFCHDFCDEVNSEYRVLLDEKLLLRCASDDCMHYFLDYLGNLEIDKKVYYSLLESMVYLIESHSVLTAGHSHITASTAKKVASLLGMSEEKQNNLYYAGILHDIGKIAVESEILKKPGQLTNDEFDAMKDHVMHSVEILKGNIPDDIYFPAIRHHENLKGTGYPFGVSDLSVDDEVLRLSDLLAALAESRYYRDSLPIEKVIDILKEDHFSGNSSEVIYNVIIENIEELYNLVILEQEVRMNQYNKIINIYNDTVKNLDFIHNK